MFKLYKKMSANKDDEEFLLKKNSKRFVQKSRKFILDRKGNRFS